MAIRKGGTVCKISQHGASIRESERVKSILGAVFHDESCSVRVHKYPDECKQKSDKMTD
jgi:hypothetical protein